MAPPVQRPLASVLVPGSTSNLGPGFDCLGLALSLELSVEVFAGAPGSGLAVEARTEETSTWPAAGSPDRLLAAFRWVGERAAAPAPPDLLFRVRSDIPIARGLGSSGAATAAGLLLGAALCEGAPPGDALLAAGVSLEGHPDNAVPSLCGGLTLSIPLEESRTEVLRPRLHPSLAFVASWPATPLATDRARAVLPAEVPLGDAVENARRLSLLLAGLESADADRLSEGMRDRLHERHRLPLIAGAAAALAAAREAGAFAACLSGSGSALLAVADAERAERVAPAMAEAFRHATGWGTARVLRPVLEAPTAKRPG